MERALFPVVFLVFVALQLAFISTVVTALTIIQVIVVATPAKKTFLELKQQYETLLRKRALGHHGI